MNPTLYYLTIKIRKFIGFLLMLLGVLSCIAGIGLLIFSSTHWLICLGMLPLGVVLYLMGAAIAVLAMQAEDRQQLNKARND